MSIYANGLIRFSTFSIAEHSEPLASKQENVLSDQNLSKAAKLEENTCRTTVELTVKAELDCLNADVSCNMWVAIEINGLAQDALAESASEPINVVVIIDNSMAV